MHYFTINGSRTVFRFLFFFSLSLRDWGFPVTWVLDFPSHVLTLVLSYIFIPLQGILFPISLLWHLPGSPLLFLVLSGPGLPAGFPARIICMFVTGQLCRKEGRLMTTEICSDSGPVQTVPMGSMCFLASLECPRTPIQRLNSLPHKLMLLTLAKGHLSKRMYVGL